MGGTTIAHGLDVLKVAYEMATGFMALRSESERQQLVIDLQDKILHAQRLLAEAGLAQSRLIDSNGELEDKVNALNDISKLTRERGLYYAPGDDEPFCPRCAEVDARRVHLANPTNEGLRRWTCPQCAVQFNER
jgi:ribosomal protein S27AE